MLRHEEDLRPPHPRLPLGVTAVMLPELNFEEQIRLCRSLGVTHYVFRPRVITDEQREEPYSNWGNHRFDLTPQRLLEEGPKLKARLDTAGMIPFGTVPSLNTESSDDEIDLAVRGAVAAGASRVRFSPAGWEGQDLFDFTKYRDELVARFKNALQIAHDAGPVKLVIEIHQGQFACSAGLARHLLKRFPPDILGVILDLPNLAKEGQTAAHVAISALGEYLDHAHVGGARRLPGPADEAGFRPMVGQFCSIRESDLYMPQWLKLLTALDREVPLIMEDYTPHMTGAARLERTANELRDMRTGLAD